MKPIHFDKALEMLDEGIPTLIIPFFLTTSRDTFITEVVKEVTKQVSKKPLSRIYLVFVAGVSKRKALGIWTEIIQRADSAVNITQGERLEVYSFSNIPFEVLEAILTTAYNLEYR